MPAPSIYLSFPQHIDPMPSPYLSGKELGKAVYDRLKEWGVDVFYDEDMVPGQRKDDSASLELVNREYMVVILAKDTLSGSKGVQAEVQQAIKINKKIIPLFVSEFSLESNIPSELPELKALINYPGILLKTHELDSGLTTLLQRLGIKRGNKGSVLDRVPRIFWPILATFLALLFAFLALFPDEARTEWFRNLGLVSSEVADIPSANLSANSRASRTLGFVPLAADLNLPCSASIVDAEEALIHVTPSMESEIDRSIEPQTQVTVLTPVREVFVGTLWYLIGDTNYEVLGWIPAEYIVPSSDCPIPMSLETIPLALGVAMNAVANSSPSGNLGFRFEGIAGQRLNLQVERFSDELNLHVTLIFQNRIIDQTNILIDSKIFTELSLPANGTYEVVVSGVETPSTTGDSLSRNKAVAYRITGTIK